MSFMSFDYAIRASEANLQYQQGMAQNMQSVESQVRETGNRNANNKDNLTRNKIEAEYEAKSADIKAKYADKKAVLAEERKQAAKWAAIAVPAAGIIGGWLDNAMGEDALGRNGVMGQVPESQQIGLNADDVQSGNVRAYNLTGATGDERDNNTTSIAVGGHNSRTNTFEFFAVNPDSGQVNNGMQMNREEMAQVLLDAENGDPPLDLSAFAQGNPPMLDRSANPPRLNVPSDEAGQRVFNEALNGALRTDAGAGALRDAFSQHGYYVPNAGPVYQATADSIADVMGAISDGRDTGNVRGSEATIDMQGMGVRSFSQVEDRVGEDLERRAGPQTSFASKVFKPILANVSSFIELAKAWKELADEAEQARLAAEQAKEQAALAYKKLGELTGQIEALGTE